MTATLSRRNFMVRAILAIFALIGSIMAVALGGFGIMPVLKTRTSEWSDAGTISGLIVDQPEERRFFEVVRTGWQSERRERSVWLVKKADGTVTVFSANCPHLGCGYRWIAGHHRFECPCHGSMFDIGGKLISGPAPRPLDTIQSKIEKGRLYVQYQVFQLGISKKVTA